MVKKKINKIKFDDIDIFEAIVLDEELIANKTKILTVLNGIKFLDKMYRDSNIIFLEPYINVDAFGTNHKLKISELEYISNWNCKLLSEIKKKNIVVYEYIKKNIEPTYLNEYNKALVRKQKAYMAKIQKQYDELLEAYTSFEYKSDIKTMHDINELLYCEAEGYMDKIEKRIEKKSNPKNMKIYKALMKIRRKDIITCEE